jgi:polysaccharide pyruvyl transferase WcaK-like protein
VTSVHDLLLLLHSVDFVVASRLHGLLLSFLASKPCIAISYDRKVRCLMDELRQADYCFDIQTFNSDDLLGALLRLQSNGHLIAPRLTATRRHYDRLLRPQYSLVAQLLRRRRGGPSRAVTLEELTHESTSDVGTIG